MKESNNPSAVRSRTLITKALLKLMEKKAYDAITISELVLSCDLTRKTFYRNYTSKDDVLNTYINDIYLDYQNELKMLKDFTPYDVLLTYFNFCKTHVSLFQLLEKQNLMTFLLPRFEEFLRQIGAEFQDLKESNAVTSYHIAFSTGGFWYLLCRWIHNGMAETPNEMAEICVQFLCG